MAVVEAMGEERTSEDSCVSSDMCNQPDVQSQSVQVCDLKV